MHRVSRLSRSMAKKIVALVGPCGSGKDHTFSIIARNFDDAKRLSFADPLKNILLATDPIVDGRGSRLSEMLKEKSLDQLKRECPEIRRLLQKMGTEGIRAELGKDVFLESALGRIGEGLTVITDLRFDNEAKAVRRLGGVIVRVERPGVETATHHSSERESELLREDYRFENDGDVAKIDGLVSFLRNRL
jgi:hypothetical protein